MSDYKIINEQIVRRATDGAFIPSDAANRDWVEYQAWLAAGNVPDPADPPPPPAPPG